VPVNLIMLGPPGAGKGTQAERFARLRRIPKISTGDILREAVAQGTELGRIAKATMDAGKLVGDDVMVGIVRERLQRSDTMPGFVLDGFPRTVAQAQALDAMMNGRGPLVVLDFVVPCEELVRRLAQRRVCGTCGWTAAADGETACAKCGGTMVQRSDDASDVVRKRLQVYERDTKPLFDYYQSRGTLQIIDGNKAPEEVSAAVDAAIGPLTQPATDAARSQKK
jgi:adenylate kinase